MTPLDPPNENHIPPDALRCDNMTKRVPAVPRKRIKLSGYVPLIIIPPNKKKSYRNLELF
jgi:hypothetical protein